eukprot:9553-Heterococcus_DN1.PRE.2
MIPMLRSSLARGALASRGARNTRALSDVTLKMVAGQAEKTAARTSPTHPSYEILSEDFIKEYGATTTLYKHTKSGAEVLSVQIDDDNKCYPRPVFAFCAYCAQSVSILLAEGTESWLCTVHVHCCAVHGFCHGNILSAIRVCTCTLALLAAIIVQQQAAALAIATNSKLQQLATCPRCRSDTFLYESNLACLVLYSVHHQKIVLVYHMKYPVKEPFVDLLKGSLQTFLNAFTYPDRTCYPVASQNTKDFYNLINVYLDAVLFPRAVKDPLVMQQETQSSVIHHTCENRTLSVRVAIVSEFMWSATYTHRTYTWCMYVKGWHYELEDKDAPLTYKGVVFNEMKGVYSSPDSLHGRACQQALFPDNTYGVDSGGDPAAIPTLTFDYFKNFHRRFYHPANARIYFYGDDYVPKRLELLDEYLQEFDASSVDPAASAIEWQLHAYANFAYTSGRDYGTCSDVIASVLCSATRRQIVSFLYHRRLDCTTAKAVANMQFHVLYDVTYWY